MKRRQVERPTGAIAYVVGVVMLLATIGMVAPAAAQTPMSPGHTPAAPQPAPLPTRGTTAAAAQPVMAATTLPVTVPQGAGADASITGIGICQCIADRVVRRLSCLGSAVECQSSCASARYSWVPHAITCPLTEPDRAPGG